MLTRIVGEITQREDSITIHSDQRNIVFKATDCKIFLLYNGKNGNYVIPVCNMEKSFVGHERFWLLPESITSPKSSLLFNRASTVIKITPLKDGYEVEVDCHTIMGQFYENRPRCDFFGNRIMLNISNGDLLGSAYAAFYWDSMLPMVVERTVASAFPYSDGYVLSTLQKGAYPGTYPDVDHEFQIKGRIAMGSETDTEVVRRMIELQLQVMREDPKGKWRNPCSIQPKGKREYHVTRGCRFGLARAKMFLLTGNIEIIESIYWWVSRTKDFKWLAARIDEIESVAGFVETHIDLDFRLWSDVYYEDQVIKDGRETIAQAFAANSFRLLAELETKLGRTEKSKKYMALSTGLAMLLVRPIPLGYWDETKNRFVDWVDRRGKVHDHIHLLANSLPLTFGYADESQTKSIEALLAEHKGVFQKFPSFVAAKIEDYTNKEIGSGGPYDLCAAGRYWCWDAEYLASIQDSRALSIQLERVAIQAANDGYLMGERYDMNYVYYQSDKMWHGAAHYYEYPNVFMWVLIVLYLGIKPDLECDWHIQPNLNETGEVGIANIRYVYGKEEFTLTNLGTEQMTIRLDLKGLYDKALLVNIECDEMFVNGSILTLMPDQSLVLKKLVVG